MDQIKIGKFISDERKQKHYTQRQLAQLLNISDKTISKWETGNGFPEVSTLLPLCEILDISVNDLLSGERLSDTDYKVKAEENMVQFIQEKEENRKKIQTTSITGLISLISFLTLIMVVCVYTNVMSLSFKILLVIIATIIFATGFYVAVQGDRTIGYYQCKHCGEHFVPSLKAYTMGPHFIVTRRLKCPNCQKTSWCRKVLSKDS